MRPSAIIAINDPLAKRNITVSFQLPTYRNDCFLFLQTPYRQLAGFCWTQSFQILILRWKVNFEAVALDPNWRFVYVNSSWKFLNQWYSHAIKPRSNCHVTLSGGKFTLSTQLKKKLNYPVIVFHRRSTTVSLENYPLYSQLHCS